VLPRSIGIAFVRRCNKPRREIAHGPAQTGPYKIASPQEQ
jgi:hypothetical protein